ncbi:MAG: hypothetical protein IJ122_02865 [Methanobrevibacter sp.]|nr:hypothetical protein [Methanobrevibacter sp.]
MNGSYASQCIENIQMEGKIDVIKTSQVKLLLRKLLKSPNWMKNKFNRLLMKMVLSNLFYQNLI